MPTFLLVHRYYKINLLLSSANFLYGPNLYKRGIFQGSSRFQFQMAINPNPIVRAKYLAIPIGYFNLIKISIMLIPSSQCWINQEIIFLGPRAFSLGLEIKWWIIIKLLPYEAPGTHWENFKYVSVLRSFTKAYHIFKILKMYPFLVPLLVLCDSFLIEQDLAKADYLVSFSGSFWVLEICKCNIRRRCHRGRYRGLFSIG